MYYILSNDVFKYDTLCYTNNRTFDFTLQGSDKVRTCKLSETLGDSGATVIEAEISPISLHVTYDMPLQMTEIDGVDENGQAIKSSTFVE